MNKYSSGAMRADSKPRYRDVSLSFIKRVGEAFKHGADKYEKDLLPWEKNWKKGDISFALDAIDHAVEHLLSYKEYVLNSLEGRDIKNIDDEDHLGHLGANLVMLDFFENNNFWDPTSYEYDTVENSQTPAPTSPPQEEETWREKLSSLFNLKPKE